MQLRQTAWDHNGNKCLHFFESSFYLMYFVFISYVYLYNVLHFILNKSIHPIHLSCFQITRTINTNPCTCHSM